MTALIALFSLAMIIYSHSIKNYNNAYEFHIKKEYNLAMNHYNKAIKLNPLYAAAYANRGILFAEQQEYELAIDDYNKAIKLKPQHPNEYLNRSCVYIEKHEYDLAIVDINTVLKLAPTNVDAYFNKGYIYELQGRRQDAIHIYQDLIKTIPDDRENIEKAKAKIKILEGNI